MKTYVHSKVISELGSHQYIDIFEDGKDYVRTIYTKSPNEQNWELVNITFRDCDFTHKETRFIIDLQKFIGEHFEEFL